MASQHIVLFGGAGFIGSALAGQLLGQGHQVTVFDSLYTGKLENLAACEKNPGFKFIKADMRKLPAVRSAIKGADIVYHLAANADIRGGMENTYLDLDMNFITTYNLLEAMRHEAVKKVVFTSSSAVYGEPSIFPTPESYGPLIPTSIYGASKLASESYISAFCEAFGLQSVILRFVNILGSGNNHGVVGDFIRKLKTNPKKLQILGDGKQRKSSLHISDCLSAIELAVSKSNDKVGIYNFGNNDYVTVDDIARIVCREMDLRGVAFEYTGGPRGWIGDMPFVFLDNKKIKSLGWKPRYNSEQAVRQAAHEMLARQDIGDKHKQHF